MSEELARANRILAELKGQGYTEKELKRLSYLVLVNAKLAGHVKLEELEIWADEQETGTNGDSV